MPPATDWKEQIPADEAERFERYAAMFGERQRSAAKQGSPLRALHAKANLGLEAELAVLPDLPPEARLGMFAEPKTYQAFVRFSNGAGRHQGDSKPDIRGIAVKVLGVPGKKLIPGMEDAMTQDFLAIRTPAIPMRNADEFVTLVRVSSPAALVPLRLIKNLGFGRGLGMLKALLASLRVPTAPLAATTYYSALPITYGPYAVHFAFVPHDTSVPSGGKGPTYLGDQLAARLREKPVSYDLRIQFYQDATRTPIEDASVEWQASDAPFITIARLTLPVQDPSSPRGVKVAEFVEQLAFDPWHAREDLRPLGNIMRARNQAYRVSTQGRKAAAEPTAPPQFSGIS